MLWPSRSLQVHGCLFLYQAVKVSSAADRRQCSSSAVFKYGTGLNSRRAGLLNRFNALRRKPPAYNGVSASLWRHRGENQFEALQLSSFVTKKMKCKAVFALLVVSLHVVFTCIHEHVRRERSPYQSPRGPSNIFLHSRNILGIL